MAKKIMVQGTTSNAGKSLIVAGLCRILKEDGYKVAPFKAQNMALNSFITTEGLEMGRAQVVQAEAAGINPTVAMNPILLKPTNDNSSQVIVHGEVWQDMSAKEYYRNKRVLVPEIEKAFKTLEESFDVIVIEGAGSPAEINLKEQDIVNMFMAHLVDAPVVLVGDIDRGGVFASLVGTMALFDPEEKERVKGLIINKFRGDLDILLSGMDILEEKTEKKVLGVIPYLDVDIEEEDSLTERFHRKEGKAMIEIAVVRLPRISNFTDFQVLEGMEGVNVYYVERMENLGNPDMIFLPGTKNTVEDLLWMRENGIEAMVKKKGSSGVPIFGICGGYQMLGKELRDPHGVEGNPNTNIKGMDMLPTITEFEEEKTRTRVTGKIMATEGFYHCLEGVPIEGYEIHMGKTYGNDGREFTTIGDKKVDGCVRDNVAGSYVHGILDKKAIVESLLKGILERKGYKDIEIKGRDEKTYKEEQYSKLAQGLRDSLDMEQIYKILEGEE